MYRVVYRDVNDRTYSAPLEWDASSSSWLMRTNEGLQKIVYLFHDDRAGNLFFQSFREEAAPVVEPDDRLHVEGQGFRALQNAVAKERLRNEEERASRRAEALTAMNEPDARKIQQARAINSQFAQALKPKREVIPPPISPKEDMAEQHRVPRNWRKKDKE